MQRDWKYVQVDKSTNGTTVLENHPYMREEGSKECRDHAANKWLAKDPKKSGILLIEQESKDLHPNNINE